MTYDLPLPMNFRGDIDNAGTIQRWLESQPCTVHSVSILNNDGTLKLSIVADEDPSPYLTTFPESKTQNEQITEGLDALDLDNLDELKTAVHLLRAALNV